MILVLAILLGCANAVDMPVRQSFAIELVGREDVGNAVALNSAMFNGSRIIGPALAGLTIGAFGVAAAFAINALSFLAVIVALLMLDETSSGRGRGSPTPRSGGRGHREPAPRGSRYVRQTPLVLLAVLVVGGVATFGMNFSVLIPAFAADDLASGAAGYGFLMAASGSARSSRRWPSRSAASPERAGSRPARSSWASPRWRWRRSARTPSRSCPDGPHRLRWHLDGGHRQRHDPARRPGRPAGSRDERLHHDLRQLGPDRRTADGRGRLRLRAGRRDRDRRRPVAVSSGSRPALAARPASVGPGVPAPSHDRRRGRGPHRPHPASGRPARGGPRRRPLQHGPDDRPTRGDVALPRPAVHGSVRLDAPRALEADGVDLSLVIRTEAPTTLAVAELDDGGAATYRFHTAETVGARPRPPTTSSPPWRPAPRRSISARWGSSSSRWRPRWPPRWRGSPRTRS